MGVSIRSLTGTDRFSLPAVALAKEGPFLLISSVTCWPGLIESDNPVIENLSEPSSPSDWADVPSRNCNGNTPIPRPLYVYGLVAADLGIACVPDYIFRYT